MKKREELRYFIYRYKFHMMNVMWLLCMYKLYQSMQLLKKDDSTPKEKARQYGMTRNIMKEYYAVMQLLKIVRLWDLNMWKYAYTPIKWRIKQKNHMKLHKYVWFWKILRKVFLAKMFLICEIILLNCSYHFTVKKWMPSSCF